MIHDMIMAAAGASGPAAPSDADFENTVLLLHGDGTNGAQNNTFLDSSTNNFTITRNGNTTQGTFTPFSKPDGRWGNYFDGTGDYLSTASNNALVFGTSNYTVEAWIYQTARSGTQWIIGGASGTLFQLGINSSGFIFGSVAGVGDMTAATTAVSLNAWTHIAIVRSSTSSGGIAYYINGVAAGTATNATNYTANGTVNVGTTNNGTGPFNGYISNIRVVNGTAVYTSAFTPSTAPLTAITNTSLLTCQSNRFIDNSSNNFTITRNGDVKVTPFSPFPTLTAYDAATNGGSGYFDGTGDYLTVADSAEFDLAGDYTIEFWWYPLDLSASSNFFSLGNESSGQNGITIYWSSGSSKVVFYSNAGAVITSSISTPANAWYHIAVVRSGGGSNNTTLYINGTSAGTATNTTSFTGVAGNGVSIGAAYSGSFAAAKACYMSNVRIVDGTAITPPSGGPTSPLTAVSGTSLLLNFTNAGIFDNTGFNNLETVGNAQIDTTTKKYGTGSMEFDGTGDYLQSSDTILSVLGSSDWTIEFWINPTVNNATAGLVVKESASNGYNIYLSSSGKASVALSSNGSSYDINVNGSTTINTGTWYHIAVVRSGSGTNNIKLYVNGTQDVQATFSGSIFNAGFLRVGSRDGASQYFNGYIDDLRITKGIARYTSNFTPPTAALPDIGT